MSKTAHSPRRVERRGEVERREEMRREMRGERREDRGEETREETTVDVFTNLSKSVHMCANETCGVVAWWSC